MESDVGFIMGAMDTLGVAASAATILQTALALAKFLSLQLKNISTSAA